MHFINLGFLLFVAGISSGKPANHERKNTLTPTQRESVPAKSPVPGVDPVVTHSPFDPHHRGATPEVYRGHLPPHLDPAMPFHRALDPGNTFVLFFLVLEILYALIHGRNTFKRQLSVARYIL